MLRRCLFPRARAQMALLFVGAAHCVWWVALVFATAASGSAVDLARAALTGPRFVFAAISQNTYGDVWRTHVRRTHVLTFVWDVACAGASVWFARQGGAHDGALLALHAALVACSGTALACFIAQNVWSAWHPRLYHPHHDYGAEDDYGEELPEDDEDPAPVPGVDPEN